MNGKGDSTRPLSVDRATYAANYDRIFGTVKKRDTCELSENATPFGSTSPPPRPCGQVSEEVNEG